MDNRQGDNTHVELEHQDWGLQWGNKERIFRPVEKNDAGSYLQVMKGFGLSAKEKQKRRCNRELEKSASQTRSIVEMFSAHRNQNQSDDKDVTPDAASVALSPKTLKKFYYKKWWRYLRNKLELHTI